MGRDPRKLVFGVAQCMDCRADVPAGVFVCTHCHSPSGRVAISQETADGMTQATAKGDECAAFMQSGRIPEAIAVVREAIAMNPWNAKAHNNLAYLLRQTGELDEAAECLERAFLLSPKLEGLKDQLYAVSKQIGSVDGWMCHSFDGVFEFGNTEDARNAVRIIPVPIFKRFTTREVMPGTPAGLKLAGESLMKAEIWFTILALRARGSLRQMFALPKTSAKETERAIQAFVR